MSIYLWIKFAHILAFVYWLGGDLGTFFGSRYVVDASKSKDARAMALKIMMACDQGPKIAMPLIFPLGMEMAISLGFMQVIPLIQWMIWIIALVWCWNVNYLYFSTNVSAKKLISRFDFYLRITMVLAIVVFATMDLLDQSLIQAEWLSYKMLIFALMVVFGLLVRIALKNFPADFRLLMIEGPNDALNARLRRQMKLEKPWVWGIWAGLFANAMIGIHLLNGSIMLVVLVGLLPLPLLYLADRRYPA
jgi:uncharacterized membrane protein